MYLLRSLLFWYTKVNVLLVLLHFDYILNPVNQQTPVLSLSSFPCTPVKDPTTLQATELIPL